MTLSASARSLNPEQRAGNAAYSVLCDAYRGNTVAVGLLRGRSTTDTPRVADTIFCCGGLPICGHGSEFEEHTTAN